MAYAKKDWSDGEVITEAALDNIENGISANDTKNTEQDGKITALEEKTGEATSSKAGLMSAADKSKLDGIAAQANKYTLPAATTSVLGGVKKSASVAKAASENVTQAEFNALIDALVASGIMEAGG